MEDISNYEKLRTDAESLYKGLGRIFCPAFHQDIYFNAEGFNPIIYKGSRSERERPSQMLRFKLLPLAHKLLKITTTHQEFEEKLKELEVTSFGKRVKKTKCVRYWGIIAIIDGRKIKVIVRKVGDNGTMHFWSIVPAWVTNQYRDTKLFSTMKGNPDED